MRAKTKPLNLSALVATVCAVGTAALVSSQDVHGRLLFSEGFEAGGNLSPWASNGDFQLHFAGLTEERAFAGKHSFKIDVTFTTCTYFYWWTESLFMPFYGKLKTRGKLLVERGTGYLGYAYAVPEIGTSGGVVHGVKIKQHPSGWQEWEADASTRTPSETEHIEGVAVYLHAKPGERVIVFVDDFEVEGDLPTDHKERLVARIVEIQAEREATYRRGLSAVEKAFSQLQKELQQARSSLPRTVAPRMAELDERLNEYCQQSAAALQTDLAGLRQTQDMARLREVCSRLRVFAQALTSRHALLNYAKDYGDRPYVVYVVPPIQNEEITPDTFPVPGVVSTELSLFACPGEYEAVTFALYAHQSLERVVVKPSALSLATAASRHRVGRSRGNAKAESFHNRTNIPAAAVDVKIVKVWWQAGVAIDDVHHPTLTPELLLNDPDIVVVDSGKKRNFLRNAKAPRDARELQPVNISAGTVQQFWVTVQVPEDAAPGEYGGMLRVTMENALPIALRLKLEVFPFPLEKPLLEYAIFYRGQLSEEPWTLTQLRTNESAYQKSERQYLAELLDMKSHGIELPSVYDGVRLKPDGRLDFSHLRKVIAVRKKAGMTKGPVLQMSHGIPIGEYAHERDENKRQPLMERIRQRTREWVKFVGETGYPTPLFYGIDEASGDLLLAQREAYGAVKQEGGHCGVALSAGFFEAVGEFMDRPVLAIGCSKGELSKIHAKGYKVWIYGNPQMGVEQPETYRRNYGLWLWRKGYDGCCNMGYQSIVGDPWDDFDDANYRDHNMTYPTIDGIVTTIQWEGWREGCDDVRYLTTLLKAVQKAKGERRNAKLVEKAEQWLKDLDVSDDLHGVRKEMARLILEFGK